MSILEKSKGRREERYTGVWNEGRGDKRRED